MTWHLVKSLCCPKSQARSCETNIVYSKLPWTLNDYLSMVGRMRERSWTKGCKTNAGLRLASAGGLTSVDKVTVRDRRPCVRVRWISGVTQRENVDLSQCVGSLICQKTQFEKQGRVLCLLVSKCYPKAIFSVLFHSWRSSPLRLPENRMNTSSTISWINGDRVYYFGRRAARWAPSELLKEQWEHWLFLCNKSFSCEM